MPITSLTCTSRQARTQSPQLMQASRLTRMALWLASVAGRSPFGKHEASRPILLVQDQNLDSGSWEPARAGWSAKSSSNTIARDFFARSVAVWTFMPADGVRMQEAASV